MICNGEALTKSVYTGGIFNDIKRIISHRFPLTISILCEQNARFKRTKRKEYTNTIAIASVLYYNYYNSSDTVLQPIISQMRCNFLR